MTAIRRCEASLPAVVSVVEKINEPRYPSFKGIMAAKKKPVATLSLADLGVEAGQVGLGAAWSAVASFESAPPRQAGTIVTDEGGTGRASSRSSWRPRSSSERRFCSAADMLTLLTSEGF